MRDGECGMKEKRPPRLHVLRVLVFSSFPIPHSAFRNLFQSSPLPRSEEMSPSMARRAMSWARGRASAPARRCPGRSCPAGSPGSRWPSCRRRARRPAAGPGVEHDIRFWIRVDSLNRPPTLLTMASSFSSSSMLLSSVNPERCPGSLWGKIPADQGEELSHRCLRGRR